MLPLVFLLVDRVHILLNQLFNWYSRRPKFALLLLFLSFAAWTLRAFVLEAFFLLINNFPKINLVQDFVFKVSDLERGSEEVVEPAITALDEQIHCGLRGWQCNDVRGIWLSIQDFHVARNAEVVDGCRVSWLSIAVFYLACSFKTIHHRHAQIHDNQIIIRSWNNFLNCFFSVFGNVQFGNAKIWFKQCRYNK